MPDTRTGVGTTIKDEQDQNQQVIIGEGHISRENTLRNPSPMPSFSPEQAASLRVFITAIVASAV